MTSAHLYIPELFGISIEVYLIWIALAVPVYFIWKGIFKRSIESIKVRRLIIWLTTILTTPIVYCLLAFLLILISEYYPNHDFNKKDWMANKDQRYEYSSDIIDSKMLIGKTKNEVRLILVDDGNLDGNNNWYYDLGYKPQLTGIDPDSLEIDFKNGKVVNVEQHKH